MGKTFVNIENVVASASMKQDLDLTSIAQVFRGLAYRPGHFSGLVYRLKRPKIVALIFSSGKMVCIGAKSERQARRAVMKVMEDLKQGGITIMQEPEIHIQNIVASGGLGGTVDLEESAYSLRRTIYEPEQFPGLIYRMKDPEVVILLFTSGKFVITGAKKQEDVNRAMLMLQKTLEEEELIHYQ
ncbi:MAG: TATA-box-binding protein [Candidatus Bathyarchaeia archaeon]